MGRLRRIGVLLFGCLVSVFSLSSQANWVEVTGRSVISEDYSAARQQAVDDAVRQALLSQGVEVSSRTSVREGMYVDDTVALQARGVISQLQIVSEQQLAGELRLTIRAQVQPQGGCRTSINRHKHAVAFSLFSRFHPQQANIGALHDVDRQLPLTLGRMGYEKAMFLGQFEPVNLEASQSVGWGQGVQSLSEIRHLAESKKVQFVATGTVLDMGMQRYFQYAHANSLSKGVDRFQLWTGMKQGDDPDQRRFAFQLRVYDAVNGHVVLDKTYSTSARWDFSSHQRVGFASTTFWRSRYGTQVTQLLDQATNDIGAKLQCQPVMTPVKLVNDENSVYLDVGVNHGIQVGDVLQAFYRDFVTPSGATYQQTVGLDRVSLKAANISLTIEQVYPQFSRARVSQPLMPSRHYIGVAW